MSEKMTTGIPIEVQSTPEQEVEVHAAPIAAEDIIDHVPYESTIEQLDETEARNRDVGQRIVKLVAGSFRGDPGRVPGTEAYADKQERLLAVARQDAANFHIHS